MLFSSLFRRRHPQPAAGRPAPRRPFIPRMEELEAREVPSTFTVSNLLDSGAGSLRAAVAAANANPGADAIDFAAGLQGTISLTSGQLSVTDNLNINGPGAGVLAVSGSNASRVFFFAAGTTNSLSGLTVENGYVNAITGGAGISNQGTLTLSHSTVRDNHAEADSDICQGGGIYNDGTLTVQYSTISGNSAFFPAFGPDDVGIRSGYGGGVYNAGTLTVESSTLSGNTAGGFGVGGAIANGFGGWTPEDTLIPTIVTINNSTLAGNTASTGGGVWNQGTQVNVTNSTIAGNTATVFSGGGIYGDKLLLNSTIVAGNSAPTDPDVSGTVLDTSSYNLIGNDSGLWGIWHGENGNQIGTADSPIDPRLGPLQDNGGPTWTMALLPGSPAIDAGDPAQLGVADQRGVVRSGGVNVGAYQASASAFVLTAPATVTAGVPFDVVVQAVDSFGQVALGYTGTVTFTTTDPDPAVVLPAAYTFTAGDQGNYPFSGGFTLLTPGEWILTATDADGGFSASITLGVDL